jgi:hypothetical protein
LLQRVGLGFAPGTWQRYWTLAMKLRDEAMTPAEHTEFISLVDRLEAANVRRIEAVAELARLRGRPFDAKFQELGLGPVGNPYEDAG